MSLDIKALPGATRYCVNGIYGVTTVSGGVRMILLRLPPEGQQLQYYFEFRDRNILASKVMKTFRIRGFSRRCAVGYPTG
jgi:hypothetical protein